MLLLSRNDFMGFKNMAFRAGLANAPEKG